MERDIFYVFPVKSLKERLAPSPLKPLAANSRWTPIIALFYLYRRIFSLSSAEEMIEFFEHPCT
jgi:hypothetical protein